MTTRDEAVPHERVRAIASGERAATIDEVPKLAAEVMRLRTRVAMLEMDLARAARSTAKKET